MSVRLSFFKLHTADMAAALAFWRDAFGFAETMNFDEPDFIEHGIALPGQEAGPSLMLVAFKDGRDVTPGPGHGPVGFEVDDMKAAHARAVAAGALPLGEIFQVGPVTVAMLASPDGHEIELVQLG
jgi:predicted enzyme related to lactoylglutathione lyase